MSLRAAINGKCKECIYDSCAPGNWRQQVTGCTIKSCSLYPYRPLSKPHYKPVSSGNLESESDLLEESEVVA